MAVDLRRDDCLHVFHVMLSLAMISCNSCVLSGPTGYKLLQGISDAPFPICQTRTLVKLISDPCCAVRTPQP